MWSIECGRIGDFHRKMALIELVQYELNIASVALITIAQIKTKTAMESPPCAKFETFTCGIDSVLDGILFSPIVNY